MGLHDDTLSRISKVSKGFQKTLNNRLDKMNFKDQTGEIYDDPEAMHPEKTVYFVQRDEDTIELWKGDIQISGKGGGWTVINALLLDGGKSSIFRAASGGDNETKLDTPSYGLQTGDFEFTTRGRQEGQNWVTRNAPLGDFNILYNYQVAVATSRTNPYISHEEDQVKRYPIYVLDILRGNVRETITIKVFQLSCHTSWMPRRPSGASYVDFPIHDTYNEVYYYARTYGCVSFQTAFYVERAVEGGSITHGYYFNNASHKGVQSVLSVNITNIHYDSNLDAVVGTPYIFPEYSKEQSCCGQLGLRRDLETGAELTEPLVIFNANHPQNYENEFIMYKILKGESIT